MYLKDFVDLAEVCREEGLGFVEFLQNETVNRLQWPRDVLEQWVYDHAGKAAFLRDYADVDLSQIEWEVEALPVETFMDIPTGPTDGNIINKIAEMPDYWVAVRKHGVHQGVALSWDVHGTWKRWPIIVDRDLLGSEHSGLQLVEGRNRVGILRGRKQQGKYVADRQLAWVGRRRE